MSSIKKFMKSKARPGDLLTTHLEEVKESIEYF